MKTLLTILGLITVLVVTLHAGPHHVDTKRNITGVVAEYDKSKGILILSDFTDWDGAQMDEMRVAAAMRRDKRIAAWFDQQDKKHAAIYIHKDDMKGIHRGTKLIITGYTYISDERTVIPKYDSFEIVH